MCGIVFVQLKDQQTNATKAILKRYHKQKSRGQEGYGIVSFNVDTLEMGTYARTQKEKEIIKVMSDLKGTNNAILFHHRNPTSTPNLAECAHPIKVDNPELEDIYYVVHNGVITNTSTLKTKHDKLKYKYQTEIMLETIIKTNGENYAYPATIQWNDSEALAIELARFIEKKSYLVDAEGSIAFVLLRVGRDNKIKSLHWGRNYQSPLFLEQDTHHFCLKSEGDFENTVDGHKLYTYDYTTKQTTEVDMELDRPYMGYHLPTSTHTKHLIDERYQAGITEQTELDEDSMLDYPLNELMGQGYDLNDIKEDTFAEYVDVEQRLLDTPDKHERKLLDKKRLALSKRLDLIESKQIDLTDPYSDEPTEPTPKQITF